MAATPWIVVADARRARIIERRGDAATELEDLVSPDGRAKARKLASDASGRCFAHGGAAAGPGHAAAPGADPVEHADDLFAKRIARALDKARLHRRYDELWFVASAKMLGRLRAELTTETARQGVRSLDEDLAGLELRALLAHLGPAP